jgi:hypothetical protein
VNSDFFLRQLSNFRFGLIFFFFPFTIHNEDFIVPNYSKIDCSYDNSKYYCHTFTSKKIITFLLVLKSKIMLAEVTTFLEQIMMLFIFNFLRRQCEHCPFVKIGVNKKKN